MNTHIQTRAATLAVTIALLAPGLALAQTTDVTSQIQVLLNQIRGLQQQIEQLRASAASSTMSMASTTRGWMDGSLDNRPPVPRMASSTPCAIFNRNLSQGVRGDDVRDLQDMLISQNLLSGTSTGFFGRMTSDAVRKMQDMMGVASSSTGFFGPLTRKAMQDRCDNEGLHLGEIEHRGALMASTTLPFPPMHRDGEGRGGREMMASTTNGMMWPPRHDN